MSEPPRNPNESSGIYELEDDTLSGPSLPGDVVRARDVDRLVDLVAADLVAHSMNCVRQFGDFHLALCGGPSAQVLYERLMYDLDCRNMPWRRTHLWIVAETCVPLHDEDSVFRGISETIADHADIPPDQVHPIFALAEDADAEYERQLKESLGWREKGHDRLDFVLLAMGDDGRIAGLHPGTAALKETARLVRRNDIFDGPARVTMTFPLINAARFTAVLTCGEGCAATVQSLAEGASDAEALPAAGLRPVDGELKWYIDDAAAGEGD